MATVTDRPARLTGHDLYLFREGTHSRLYEKLGAHVEPGGTHFAVWAPNAAEVSVIGDFNGWDRRANPMQPNDAGIWSALTPLRRVGTPEDVARAIAFLAGDRADFITGQTLYVDGGLWSQVPWPYARR